MSFSKRSNTGPVCYTKPLDSLKHWNESFFWVDASTFPLSIPWHNNKTLKKDPHPTPTEFNAKVCDFLATHPAPFQRFPESFLCLVGISRYYELDDNIYLMDLFAFINHADPTKVRIGRREVREGEGEVSLLESTRGRVVLLACVNEQGNQNDDVQDAGVHVVNEEGRLIIVGNDKINSGYSSADINEGELERERGEFPSCLSPYKRTCCSCLLYFMTQATRNDDVSIDAGVHVVNRWREASFFDLMRRRGKLPDGAYWFKPVPPPKEIKPTLEVTKPVPIWCQYLEQESKSLVNKVARRWKLSLNLSALDDPDVCRSLVDQLAPPVLFSQLRGMDYDQLFTEFNVGAARQTCLGAKVRMQTDHILREKKKLKGRCSRQADSLKERDVEIASLKAQLSLKEAEVAEAIRLRGQESVTEAARVVELNSLKDQTTALEGHVAALESASVIKDTELASSNAQITKLIQDLSNFQLSYDELSVKAASLESKKINSLTKCLCLRPHVLGFVIRFRVMSSSRNNMKQCRMTGRRWILGRGLRLVVMKCLHSPKYLAALGGAIGHAIDKGMQDGLVADINHGKVGRGLADVAAYNPSAKANYVSAVNALRAVDFPLLAQLASQKNASTADIMGLFHLEGPAAETPEANQLQPSLEKLVLPIHRPEDQVVIGETSLSFSLDVVHARPLSAANLVGEASTSCVSAAVAATTALSTTFVQASSVPPVPVSDYEVADTEPQAEAPSSKIIFEQETLETLPEHPAT
ncbi:hypothetical protein Tco_1539496 [Tanacetum coccineum]